MALPAGQTLRLAAIAARGSDPECPVRPEYTQKKRQNYYAGNSRLGTVRKGCQLPEY